MMEVTDWIARILFWLCGVEACVFVVRYALYSKWWVTDVGRMLMGLFVSMAYICLLSAVRFFAGNFPGEDVFRIVGYLAIAIGICYMIRSLYRIQTEPRKHPLMPRHEREKEHTP